MSGLLLPAYSLVLDNRLGSLTEKLCMMLYYILLGLILLFPFLYIARISTEYRDKGKKKLLRSGDIETLSQYFLNMCLSLTLGIQKSPIPFIVTTFIVLSLFLIYSLIQGGEQVNCGSCSLNKVNNVIHKLTFWLYNFVFLGMYLLGTFKGYFSD